MTVMQIAQTAPAIIAPAALVAAGIRMMRDRRVGGLMVVDGGRLEGAFTERDVMDRIVLARRDPDTTPIREVMTTPVRTIRAEESVDEALRIMREHRVRHLPVVRDGRLVGLVSLRYLLRDKVDALVEDANALCALLSADGIGG
jgi:CBS domain-containing protein